MVGQFTTQVTKVLSNRSEGVTYFSRGWKEVIKRAGMGEERKQTNRMGNLVL